METVEKGFWQLELVQTRPVGQHIAVEEQSPSKMALS
jgi:hypothetical protein